MFGSNRNFPYESSSADTLARFRPFRPGCPVTENHAAVYYLRHVLRGGEHAAGPEWRQTARIRDNLRFLGPGKNAVLEPDFHIFELCSSNPSGEIL